MGKRELLIVGGFILIGIVAFQFTAPPAKTEGGFSIAKMIDSVKREIKGRENYPTPPRTLAFKVGSDIDELRLVGIQGPLTVQGEAREDIEMVLVVQSTGESYEAAVAIANTVKVIEDRVGNLLKLEMKYPLEERQRSQAVLKVPQRLAIRLESPQETSVSNVRALSTATYLRGNSQIDKIAEHVSGEQRDGTLTLSNVKTVKMRLTRTRTRIAEVTGGITLDITDGQTEITGSSGPLEIDQRRAAITIGGHRGTVRVGGSDGRITVAATTDEVRIDVRRAEVDAELAPRKTSSIVTTDERLKVTLSASTGVEVDAVVIDGAIDVSDWNLTAVKKENETRFQRQLGLKSADAPRVSLRNQGGDIVIRKQVKNKQ